MSTTTPKIKSFIYTGSSGGICGDVPVSSSKHSTNPSIFFKLVYASLIITPDSASTLPVTFVTSMVRNPDDGNEIPSMVRY